MDHEGSNKPQQSYVSRPVGILRKQLGYKWEYPHPNLARAIVPTIPYESLDSSGEKIMPWSLLKLFNSCELSDFWPFQDEAGGRHQNTVLYMLNMELEIDRTLYSADSPKFPLYIDKSVKFVKRSSRCIEGLLRHPDVDQPYARASSIDVNMDPDTRKPKPFPIWWKDQFNFPTDGPRLEFKEHPKPSSGVYSSHHRINFSDTDENKHAKYTTYVRLCYDSFCEHVLSGKYGATLNVYEIGLKKLQITYLKDVKLGDILTVDSWEDSIAKDTYHFEMNNNGVMSATVTMDFHNLLKNENERTKGSIR